MQEKRFSGKPAKGESWRPPAIPWEETWRGAQRRGDGHCSLVEPKGGKGGGGGGGNRAEDVKLGTGLFNGAMAALYKQLRALSQCHQVAPALGKLVRLRQCLK